MLADQRGGGTPRICDRLLVRCQVSRLEESAEAELCGPRLPLPKDLARAAQLQVGQRHSVAGSGLLHTDSMAQPAAGAHTSNTTACFCPRAVKCKPPCRVLNAIGASRHAASIARLPYY